MLPSREAFSSRRSLEAGCGDFVLLGEAVAPGFDFRDFAFVTAPELQARPRPTRVDHAVCMAAAGCRHGT